MSASSATAMLFNVFGRDVSASKTLGQVGSKADETGKKLEGVGGKGAASMDKLAKQSVRTGKGMTLGLTVPIAAIGASAVKTASEFGVTMASMKVNAGIATDEGMEPLRNMAMKLGADTVFSAGEAADAMLELSKAGLSVKDIGTEKVGALKSTMALAATEGIGLSDAAVIMANSMAMFNVKGDKASEITGLLAAGAVASTAGVADLAAGLKYVGSTAHALNVPMNDTVTALAALNTAGLDSSTAGTSLNRFFLGLIPKSQKAQDTFAELDVTFQNANGTLKTMPEIIGVLGQKMDGMAKPDRVRALKDMFGVEGMRAANILMEQGSKGWTKLSKDVNKAGVDTQLAGARMSGMAGAIETMKGSLETASLTIGESMQPGVELLAGWITKLANGFTSLSPGLKTTAVVMAAVVAVAGPMLIMFGKAVQAVMLIQKAMVALNITMSLNPFGIVVLAIAALVAAFVIAWKSSQKFRQAVTVAFSAVGKAVLTLVGLWLKGANFMADVWLKVAEVIVKGAAKALGWVPGVGPKLKAAAAGFDDFRDGVHKTINSAIAKTESWKRSLDAMPKKVKLQGDIADLESKLSTAKRKLEDPDLSKKRRAKIEADIADLSAKVASAKAKIASIKGKTVDIHANVIINGKVVGYRPKGGGPTQPIGKVYGMATGGIVRRRPGGILANIGEGRYDEAVVPLPRGGGLLPSSVGGSSGGGDLHVHFDNAIIGSKEDLARYITDAQIAYGRAKGTPLFAGRA